VAIEDNFQFDGVHAFLTFPQCDVDKDVAMANLLADKRFVVHYAAIAEELHQDGEKHLHCFIRFDKRLHLRGSRCFDTIAGEQYHANVQSARSPNRCLDYVKKHGNVKEYTAPGQKAIGTAVKRGTGQMAQDVLDMFASGASVAKVAMALPQAAYIRGSKGLCDMANLVKQAAREARILPWIGVRALVDDDNHRQLAEWFNANIQNKTRAPRTRQLYLFGKPGIGKSRLVNQLAVFNRVWSKPKSANKDEWFDGYDDNSCDLICMEEFVGSIPPATINAFIEGGRRPLTFPVKGGHVTKESNHAVIILSNYSPDKAYAGSMDRFKPSFDAFLERLLILDFDEVEVKLEFAGVDLEKIPDF